MSAGGYHHHIGLNTWAGVGAPPAPPGAIGLRHLVVRLPVDEALARVLGQLRSGHVTTTKHDDGVLVRDPSGNAILLTVGH